MAGKFSGADMVIRDIGMIQEPKDRGERLRFNLAKDESKKIWRDPNIMSIEEAERRGKSCYAKECWANEGHYDNSKNFCIVNLMGIISELEGLQQSEESRPYACPIYHYIISRKYFAVRLYEKYMESYAKEGK